MYVFVYACIWVVCKPRVCVAQVREAFVAQSSLTLPDFLRADKYAAVVSALAAQRTPAGRSGSFVWGGRIGGNVIH
jgi:hypothetical protein